jgi:flagellar L-ring protein precursor FlgH
MDPTNIVDLTSEAQSDGRGDITRNETINLEVAAVVTQVLPNGNLVIHGDQEVRVNYEVRELMVDGVVRPQDITSSNVVRHDQIAEARIAYGGRGQITDVQQPRYGQQVIDMVFPY